jgi:hypothetical protein
MFFSLSTFTSIHVAISVIGLVSGLIITIGLLKSKSLEGWTALFLISTVLTSATGFGFPFDKLLPSHVVGIISLTMLAIAIFARYGQHLSGAWRWIYIVTALIAFWFNVFVLVAQGFLKVPSLHALAPTGSEPPFAIAQSVVLLIFVVICVAALRKFHPATMGRA